MENLNGNSNNPINKIDQIPLVTQNIYIHRIFLGGYFLVYCKINDGKKYFF